MFWECARKRSLVRAARSCMQTRKSTRRGEKCRRFDQLFDQGIQWQCRRFDHNLWRFAHNAATTARKRTCAFTPSCWSARLRGTRGLSATRRTSRSPIKLRLITIMIGSSGSSLKIGCGPHWQLFSHRARRRVALRIDYATTVRPVRSQALQR